MQRKFYCEYCWENWRGRVLDDVAQVAMQHPKPNTTRYESLLALDDLGWLPPYQGAEVKVVSEGCVSAAQRLAMEPSHVGDGDCGDPCVLCMANRRSPGGAKGPAGLTQLGELCRSTTFQAVVNHDCYPRGSPAGTSNTILSATRNGKRIRSGMASFGMGRQAHLPHGSDTVTRNAFTSYCVVGHRPILTRLPPWCSIRPGSTPQPHTSSMLCACLAGEYSPAMHLVGVGLSVQPGSTPQPCSLPCDRRVLPSHTSGIFV